MRLRYFVVLMLALISLINFSFIPKAKSITTTFYPTIDGYITYRNAAFESADITSSIMFAGEDSVSGVAWYRTYLRFDVSSIPDGVFLTSAVVHVDYEYYFWLSGEEGQVQLFNINDIGSSLDSTDWNLGDITNYGTIVGPGSGTYGWKTMTVTQSVTPTSTFVSFKLKDTVEDLNAQGSRWGFKTDETTSRPYLEVTFTYYPTNDSLQLDLTGASYKGTKTLLSSKQDYKFVAKVSDLDGVTGLFYVDLTLDYGGKNVILRVERGIGDLWTFSELSDPSNYVTLGTSSHTTSGNQKTFNFMVKINWNWDDSPETTSARLYSVDMNGLTDDDTYSNVFGVENDLGSSGLSVSDSNRVNPSQALTMSGYWYYQGTSIYPPDGNYQVQVKLSGVQKGSTDTTLVSGAFSIAITAESSVASYMYTVEATYMAAAGTFSAVIVDKIVVTISANVTNPTNTQTVQLTTTATYQYDNAAVSTLSFQMTRNGSNFATTTPVTDGPYTDTKYVYTISSASETTHGLNIFSTNTITITWGPNIFIEAWQILVDDTRADVSSNVYLRYRLRFSNNQSGVNSGTIWINGTSHTISSGWANFTITSATVGKKLFVETAVNVNGEQDYGQLPSSPEIIWDRFEFVSVTVDDSHINIGATFELRYIIRYDYDDVPFSATKGTVDGFTFDGINGWWKKTVTGASSPTSTTFDETYVSITDSTYDLTAKQDVPGAAVITDGMELSTQQIDLTNNQLKLRLLYAYDNSTMADGNVTFAAIFALSNSTGWAIFNLDSLSDVSWGLTAYGIQDSLYGITYKYQNQTILLHKISGVLVQTESGLILSSSNYQNGQLNMVLTGSGTKYVRVTGSKPYYVKVGTLYALEGTKWSYNASGGYTQITESYSTKNILVSWLPLSLDGTGGTGGDSSKSKSAPEQFAEAVSTAVFALSSNYVGAIVFVLAVIGFVVAWRFEERTLAVILGVVTFYLLFDLVAVFVLKPLLLFPGDLRFLEPLLWAPPSLALEMFGPLAVQQLVQLLMMGSLFAILVGAIYGVSQR